MKKTEDKFTVFIRMNMNNVREKLEDRDRWTGPRANGYSYFLSYLN